MKKKKSKIKEPQYACCSAYYNYCGEIVRKYLILNKSELMKRLNNGERFEYVFNIDQAVKVDIQISLEEEHNDDTTS
jgi:hypothetical protein